VSRITAARTRRKIAAIFLNEIRVSVGVETKQVDLRTADPLRGFLVMPFTKKCAFRAGTV